MQVTRLAPSPTGALHLGNARTFLINWLVARQLGWKIILRIEDIDGPRIKRSADRQAIEDLEWLGIDWDEGPVYQSVRGAEYKKAIDRLIDNGHAYPCTCSRSEVTLAASAPHAEDGSSIYPGTCRGRYRSVAEARSVTGKAPALRFEAPQREVVFEDAIAGRQAFDVRNSLGDFVIAKADGTPAYQLAVVVDDAEMGVTDVIRGDDLLDSAPRQMLLYRALGIEQKQPRYWHLPLVRGEDGRRLAKRHGDTRLATYRSLNVPRGRVLALLARWSGVGAFDTLETGQLLERFRIESVPREPVTFTAADDRWLRQAAIAGRA
jgi:glutamyl-tRNA synthetase